VSNGDGGCSSRECGGSNQGSGAHQCGARVGQPGMQIGLGRAELDGSERGAQVPVMWEPGHRLSIDTDEESTGIDRYHPMASNAEAVVVQDDMAISEIDGNDFMRIRWSGSPRVGCVIKRDPTVSSFRQRTRRRIERPPSHLSVRRGRACAPGPPCVRAERCL
jgi:hypothetical protein